MSQTTLFIEGSLHRTTTVRPVGRVLLKGKFVCSSGNWTCELAFNSISGYLVFYWIKTKIFFYGSFNSKSRLLIIWLVVWSPPQPIKCHWTMTLSRQIAPSLFVFCGKDLSCIGQKKYRWDLTDSKHRTSSDKPHIWFALCRGTLLCRFPSFLPVFPARVSTFMFK